MLQNQRTEENISLQKCKELELMLLIYSLAWQMHGCFELQFSDRSPVRNQNIVVICMVSFKPSLPAG